MDLLSIIYSIICSLLLFMMYQQTVQLNINVKRVSLFVGLLFIPILVTDLFFNIYLPILIYVYNRYIDKQHDKLMSFFYSMYISFTCLSMAYYFYSTFVYSLYHSHRMLYKLIVLLCVFLLHTITIKIVKFDFNLLKNNDEYIRKEIVIPIVRVIFIGNIVLQICLILIENNIILRSDSNYLLLAIFIITIFIIERLKIKESNYKQEILIKNSQRDLNNIVEYSKKVESLYAEVRSFRHDYANLLASLDYSIENKNLEEIDRIYRTILLGTNQKLQSPTFSITNLSNVHILSVKSVLAKKFQRAEDYNIKAFLEVNEEITSIDMEESDFIRIFSILIDNAIEAAVLSTKKEVNFGIIKKKDSLMAVVRNSQNQKTTFQYSISKIGNSTKGENRGVGLYSLKHILESYSNVSLYTENMEDSFTQKIVIGSVE